jgi:hypothetical protein
VRLPDPAQRVWLGIPHAEAGLLSRIYAQGRVVRREDTAEGMLIEAEIPPGLLARLQGYVRTGPPRTARRK